MKLWITILSFSLMLCTSFFLPAQSSIKFDGTNDWLQKVDFPPLEDDYTIEYFLQIDAPGNSIWSALINFDQSANTPWFGIRNEELTLEFWDGVEILRSTESLPLDEWIHVAYVGNNQTGGKMYFNGKKVGEHTVATTIPDGIMEIGRTGGLNEYFNGKIDELRISNSARYDENFTPTIREFSLDENTFALYHFNENEGQIAFDVSGNALHLQLGSTEEVDNNDPNWCNLNAVLVDNDGDGFSQSEDCNDNDPNIGANQPEGTPCNDNNPMTENDQILSDGCTCAGAIIVNETVTVTGTDVACGIDNGLLAYYPFNGNTNDESGNGHGASTSGNPTLIDGVKGENSGAYDFDGNDIIEINDNVDDFRFNNSSLSISAWVTIPDNAVSNYYYMVSIGNPNIGIDLYKRRGGIPDGNIAFLNRVGSRQFFADSKLTGEELPKNTWLHLVGITDVESQQVKLYLNGELQASVDSDLELDFTNQSNFKVQYGVHTLNGGNFHKGDLDNVRIYNRVLSDMEILELFDCEKPDNTFCVNNGVDIDEDGICDIEDNCPQTPNPDQLNADNDIAGAACDCDDSPETGASCTDGCQVFYRDMDEDGFGNSMDSVMTCIAPVGFVDNADDCDDADATKNIGNTCIACDNVPSIQTTQISSGGNETFVLFENDFEKPIIPAADITTQFWYDVSSQRVKDIFGFEFTQTNTIETVLINGARNQYQDSEGRGGNFAIGMLNTSFNDKLAFTFDRQNLPFLNLMMDIAAVDLFNASNPNGRYGVNTPIFKTSVYDTPTGTFSFGSPGVLLSSDEAMGFAPDVTKSVFNWASIMTALDVSAASSNTVTIVIELLQSGYATFDNVIITSSTEAGSVGNQITAKACETSTLIGTLTSEETARLTASFGSIIQNGSNWTWTSPELQVGDSQMVTILAANNCGMEEISFELVIEGSNCTNAPCTQLSTQTFTSQAQLDAFVCDCPTNSLIIDGDLIINGDDITDLSNLSCIKTVTGNVLIGDSLSIPSNDILETLNGLGSIMTIGGDLVICNNPMLRDLDGFSNLMEVGGNIEVKNCIVLSSIRLIVLQSVGGGFYISGCPFLIEIGPWRLSGLGGGLTISGSFRLTSIGGFGSLTSIGGDLYLVNSGLADLTEFKNLIRLFGCFHIIGNEQIIDMRGLSNLQELGGIRITDNNLITNLDSLRNLTTITGSIILHGNGALTSIEGLENVSAVGDTLEISFNSALQVCCPLNDLIQNNGVGGPIIITGNAAGCQDEMDINLSCMPVDTPNLPVDTPIILPPTCVFSDPLVDLTFLADIVENPDPCYLEIRQGAMNGEPIFIILNENICEVEPGILLATELDYLIYDCAGNILCAAGLVNDPSDCRNISIEGTTLWIPDTTDMVCTSEFLPVCSNGITYPNACEAEKVGVFDYFEGECILIEEDFDGDGFTIEQGDCDDNNPDIYPDAAEIPCNGIDENCDGIDNSITDEPCASEVDCPEFGLNIGQPCDDNNPTTENEWLEEGCICVGQVIDDCAVNISVAGNSIIVENLNYGHNKALLFDRTFSNAIDTTCTYWVDCGGTQSFDDLLPGVYAVQIQTFSEDWSKLYCDFVEYVEITANTNTDACADLGITLNGNELSITELPTLNTIIDLFDSRYAAVFRCVGDCGTGQVIENLLEGSYSLRVKVYDNDWNFLCEIEETLEVVGTSIITADDRINLSSAPNTSTAINRLKIAPNPSSEQIQIQMEDFMNLEVDLMITDILGRRVYQKYFDKVDHFISTVDIHLLDVGVYQVSVNQNGIYTTTKLIVIR